MSKQEGVAGVTLDQRKRAELLLEFIEAARYFRGRLSKVTVDDMVLILDALPALSPTLEAAPDAETVYAAAMFTSWRRTKDFLRDRLVTSGRSDVNINAVLRVMNEALNESPE